MINISYSWDCRTVEVYPNYENKNDVVYMVYWKYRGTYNEYVYDIKDYQELSLKDIDNNFIPFDQLNNALVSSWVINILGQDKINEMNGIINDCINKMLTPTTVIKIIP